MPVKDDLRHAIDMIVPLDEKGQKSDYIDRCDLTAEDADILRRRLVLRQSRVQVAAAHHMDVRTVDRHYRKAILILAAVVARHK